MLHGGHLQICLSELPIWMFSVRYPTWLNCHLKISICNGADCVILWGGGDSELEIWNIVNFSLHMKSIEMKLKGLWCMIGDKKEIEKIIWSTWKVSPGQGSILWPTCFISTHLPLRHWFIVFPFAGPKLSKFSQASAGYSLYKLFGWLLDYSILSYTKFKNICW